MSSLRQQIADALVTRLKTITVAHGYSVDVGNSVYCWRDLDNDPLHKADCPAITFEDGSASMETRNLDGDMLHVLSVSFTLHVANSTTATTVRNGLNDIAKAIEGDETLGGLTLGYVPTEHSMDLHQDGDTIGAGTYAIEITYLADRGLI